MNMSTGKILIVGCMAAMLVSAGTRSEHCGEGAGTHRCPDADRVAAQQAMADGQEQCRRGVGCSIMAFDTEGKGERELVPEGELYNPLISPSGRHVIYTAKTDGKLQMHCVDWNGANSRVLGEGYALWAWREPATGSEWVYTSATNAGDGNDANFVDRFQFDRPEAREWIYTGRLSNHFSL